MIASSYDDNNFFHCDLHHLLEIIAATLIAIVIIFYFLYLMRFLPLICLVVTEHRFSFYFFGGHASDFSSNLNNKHIAYSYLRCLDLSVVTC